MNSYLQPPPREGRINGLDLMSRLVPNLPWYGMSGLPQQQSGLGNRSIRTLGNQRKVRLEPLVRSGRAACDRQTNGQTDGIAVASTALANSNASIAARCENCWVTELVFDWFINFNTDNTTTGLYLVCTHLKLQFSFRKIVLQQHTYNFKPLQLNPKSYDTSRNTPPEY